uniref:Serine protease n=1 Tax=Trypanosoma congolense (strain IL3000) TaxID=1068625 RepID=G0UK55_TRYCI|nr:conserved hypothetical protein [Trypanosoma congolense IL3000]
MIPHGVTDYPSTLKLSDTILDALYSLYLNDEFLGTCFAIAPRVLISAGHHYSVTKDFTDHFNIRDAHNDDVIVATYLSKDRAHDVLIIWVQRDLRCVPLRGFLPPVHARVVTVWLSTKVPHDPILSPSVVIESGADGCLAKGTVSMTGSSGAPVVDFFGDHVVGMHLTSNTRNGSRVSGFLPARTILSILIDLEVKCRWETGDNAAKPGRKRKWRRKLE